MRKLLKINGLPTHGIPKQKKPGDDGRNSYFSERLFLYGVDEIDPDYLPSLSWPNSDPKYTILIAKNAYKHSTMLLGDRFVMIKNIEHTDGTYENISLKEGDDIYVPSEQGLCIFKILCDSISGTYYIDDYPYRNINTDFRPIITYSFDNYAYNPPESNSDKETMQAIVISDFNISYTTLSYIQIYLEENNTYLPYKFEDSETTYRTEIIEITNDTDLITLRMPRKTTEASKTASIHIYGLYRTSANSYRRIFLGTEKIFPIS